MSSEIIPLLQMGIYIILSIMFLLICISYYLMSKSSNNKKTNSNMSFEEINMHVYREKTQSTYKPKDDDNGPIQNL